MQASAHHQAAVLPSRRLRTTDRNAMKCPACESPYGLMATAVEPWLNGLQCSACGGLWIPGAAFRTWWLNRPANGYVAASPTAAPLAAEDGPYLRRCPECAHILARYRVGHGMTFSVDRCRSCGGMWFDREEWQALRSRGLHETLPHLLTDEWQQALRAAERVAREEQWLLSRLGMEDLQRIREIKRWLDAHPERALLLRLLAGEPEPAQTP